jgi:lactate dehydrogenase-like 2-hydroxyacid dehydrogenase
MMQQITIMTQHMFNNILAIDIADRIADFEAKIKPYTAQKTITIKTSDEFTRSTIDTSSIDAILVSIYQPLPQSLLSLLPNVRHIFILGTSKTKVDLDYCLSHDIRVAHVTDYCDDETAEWVMMHIAKHFREHATPRSVLRKSLGVIGVGSVGKKLIALAQAFGMKVYYNTRHPHQELDQRQVQYLSKDELFATCDVISLHTPPFIAWLNKDLLLNAKSGLLLVNTCMGRVSKDNDLEEALATRRDITLIMDAIAGTHYQTLKDMAHIINQPAFSTLDSQARLIDKFFALLGKARN